MIELEDLPKELREGREEKECEFIFSLWKDPSLVDSYKNVRPGEDLLTEDGNFYFSLVRALSKQGLLTFDDMSVKAYLEDKKETREHFLSLGGFDTVHEILSLTREENIESSYDAICKSNLLIRLYEKGFPVLKNLSRFQKATAEEVYDYFDYSLASTAVDKVEHTKVVDMNTGYEDFIKKWNEGSGVGFEIGSRLLNYNLAGIHKGLTLHAAHIGKGKTTTMILLYVLPVIASGQNVLLLSNEQTESEFRQMLLGAVAFNKIEERAEGMNRQRILRGGYTKEQEALLKKAAAWLSDDARGKIQFVPLQDYSTRSLKRIIGKYSKVGYSLTILDTLKPETESATAWADFSEAAKNLFVIAHQNDIALICTCQLSGDSMARNFLDLSCIGKSRSIAETANAVVMFRHIRHEEYDHLHPFNWVKNKETGLREKVEASLDPEKEYIEVFLAKNRNGKTDPEVILEFNQDFLQIRDFGYNFQPMDAAARR